MVLLQIVVVVVCFGIAVRSVLLNRMAAANCARAPRLGSLIFCAGSLVAIALPGEQLLTGARISRLTLLGLQFDTATAVQTAYVLWLLAILAFCLGEEVGFRLSIRRPRLDRKRRNDAAQASSARRRTSSRTDAFLPLLVMGVIGGMFALYQGQQQVISDRGNVRGEGLIVLLQWGFPLAGCLAIATFDRSRAAFIRLGLSVSGTLYIVWVTGARSPLLLVGLAVLTRLLFAPGEGLSARRLLTIAVFGYISASLVVAVPLWRAQIRANGDPSPVEAIVVGASDPLGKIASVGALDTLDGLVLSTRVDPRLVGANWLDPTKALLGFVPYQLWQSKPDWLSATVTHTYLNSGGGAGIFLSGPGYAYIVYGGAGGMILAFFLLGATAGLMFRRLSTRSVILTILSYFFVRFFFGGDAFDAFQALVLLAAFGLAKVASHAPVPGWKHHRELGYDPAFVGSMRSSTEVEESKRELQFN